MAVFDASKRIVLVGEGQDGFPLRNQGGMEP